MRTIILLLACLQLQGLALAQKKTSPLTITKISGDYYVYVTYGTLDDGSAYPSNSMYVVTDKGVIMIDVPWDTLQTLPLLDSIEARHHKKVIACISTHFHADRTAGLDVLKAKGISTFATAETIALCIKRKEPVPECAIPSDTTFSFGNHTLRAFYPGPGHTSDNIVVWFPDARILYGGCFVKSTDSKDLGNLADARPDLWPASMHKVKQQFGPAKYVIPGHGSWKSNRALDHTLDLLKAYKPEK